MAVERVESDPSVELLREALSRFPAQTAPAMLFASSLMANRLAAEKGELGIKSTPHAPRSNRPTCWLPLPVYALVPSVPGFEVISGFGPYPSDARVASPTRRPNGNWGFSTVLKTEDVQALLGQHGQCSPFRFALSGIVIPVGAPCKPGYDPKTVVKWDVPYSVWAVAVAQLHELLNTVQRGGVETLDPAVLDKGVAVSFI